MYTVWIKIDESLPWIELKGRYQTSKEARKAAKDFRGTIQMRIVNTAEKKSPLKMLPPLKAR